MAIIGSREQLCIHAEVSKKESNAEKVRHLSLSLLVVSSMCCTNLIQFRYTYAEQRSKVTHVSITITQMVRCECR